MRSTNAALRTFLRLWLIFDHKNGPLMVIYLRSVSCYFGLMMGFEERRKTILASFF